MLMKRERLSIYKSPSAILALLLMGGLFIVLCLAITVKGKKAQESNSGPAASNSTLDLWIRDSATGYGLTGVIKIDGGNASSPAQIIQIDDPRSQVLQVPLGTHSFEVESSGYRSLKTRLTAEAGTTLSVTLWLDPVELPVALRSDVVQSRKIEGRTLLHGHIVDVTTGKPMSGVSVSLAKAGLRTESDERGYFALHPSVKRATAESLPEMDVLQIETPNYKTNLITNVPLTEADTHFIIEMEPGAGVGGRDDTPKLMRGEDEQRNAQLPADDADDKSNRDLPAQTAGRAGDAALVWGPPSSIRVGLNCSCRNCSSVAVMTLETYTKRGLNDEWIASWTPHSLRAGAVAYRSYGTHHIYRPININYDICSTTCCQVNDTDVSSSTNSAVDRTAGILLQRGGEVFRSEYSAENNNYNCGVQGCSNLSCTCGDGSAGSPGTGWPCLYDPVDAGRNCFGHGRGMCQWGTQRWALAGQLWNWITDHYYNNNGVPGGLRSAYMTSPMDIISFTPDPAQVFAGGAFTIYLGGANYAELRHDRVMIGASLYSPATGYISDPPSDVVVSLLPGYNDVSRSFTVPKWASADTYDLIVALWLDVDGDSAITGADLLLVTYPYPGAVTVFAKF